MSNSAILWTVDHQAPISMGFSRQEYYGGLPFSSPGDLPNPGIKSRSLSLQADSLLSEPPGKFYLLILHKICAASFTTNIMHLLIILNHESS